jgi:hypothetical protein
VDYLGILVQGAAFVIIDHKNMKDLKLGDMIGHMMAAELSTKQTHLTTVIASMDGLIAVLPFGEIKMELRRAPDAVFKTYQIASKYAMETFMFNLNGVEHNPYIKHPATA